MFIQIVNGIESVHKSGYIHRDIKPSNFVFGRSDDETSKIFLIDFGLAKQHIDPKTDEPYPPKRRCDFRGTIPYASLTAHNKMDLSRKDDMWSFFYMLIEFLEGTLPWRKV